MGTASQEAEPLLKDTSILGLMLSFFVSLKLRVMTLTELTCPTPTENMSEK